MSSAATLFGDLAGVFLAAGDLPRALPGVLRAGDDLRADGIEHDSDFQISNKKNKLMREEGMETDLYYSTSARELCSGAESSDGGAEAARELGRATRKRSVRGRRAAHVCTFRPPGCGT